VSISASVPSVTKMTNADEFHAWAVREWVKQAGNNTPLAKSIRSAKVGSQAMKREHKAVRRSLAAKHAGRIRAIRKRQVDAESALRKREAEREAEMDKRRWDLIIGSW